MSENKKFRNLAKVFTKPYAKRTKERKDKDDIVEFLLSQNYIKNKYEELKKYARKNDTYCPSLRVFMEDISRVFKCKHYDKGNLLFHMGDIGTEIIVILRGAIVCAIPKTEVQKNNEEKSNAKALNLMLKHKTYKRYEKEELIKIVKKRYSKDILEYVKSLKRIPEALGSILAQPVAFPHISEADILMLGLGKNKFMDLKDERIYHNNNVFTYKGVFTQVPGGVIGELALEKSEPRAATCYCSKKTIVLSMGEKDFTSFFENAKRDDKDKLNFLEMYFGKLPTKKMKQFSYMFQQLDYERGNFLFHQGQDVENLYILEKGQVAIFRKKEDADDNFMKMISNRVDIDYDEDVERLKVRKKRKTELNLIKLALIEQNTCLGDYDYFKSKKKNIKKIHSFSAVVQSSNAILYRLGLDNLSNALFLLGHHKISFVKKIFLKRKFIVERLKLSIAPGTMIKNFYENEKIKEYKKKKKQIRTLRKSQLVLNPMKPVEPKNLPTFFVSKQLNRKATSSRQTRNYLFGISKNKKSKKKDPDDLDEGGRTARIYGSQFMRTKPLKLLESDFFVDDLLSVKGKKFRRSSGFAYGLNSEMHSTRPQTGRAENEAPRPTSLGVGGLALKSCRRNWKSRCMTSNQLQKTPSVILKRSKSAQKVPIKMLTSGNEQLYFNSKEPKPKRNSFNCEISGNKGENKRMSRTSKKMKKRPKSNKWKWKINKKHVVLSLKANTNLTAIDRVLSENNFNFSEKNMKKNFKESGYLCLNSPLSINPDLDFDLYSAYDEEND